MNTSTTEETGNAPATATSEQLKPTKKARVAARKPHVATKKAESAHKATKGKPGKRAAKQPPKGRQTATPARDGTKTAKMVALLKRPGGATAKELMKVMAGRHIPCAASSASWAARVAIRSSPRRTRMATASTA